MRIIRHFHSLASMTLRSRQFGKSIGFIPTMGALHEGHLSLIRYSANKHSQTVVSIFVNPIQFGPKEDYVRYPKKLLYDRQLAKSAGADILFVPNSKIIYPHEFDTKVCVGGLSQIFEGLFRPGHFSGVATIVNMLFHMVQPTHSYFGQKDYQQFCVIKRMVKDLKIPVKISMRPTVRESNGLAMSSRNRYLSVSQRRKAIILYKVLSEGKRRIRDGRKDAKDLTRYMRRQLLRESGVRLDYVAIVDSEKLLAINRVRGRVVLLGAIRIGGIRLIDNLLINVP